MTGGKYSLWPKGKRRLKNRPIGFINAFWRDISDQNTILGLIPILFPVRDPMFRKI
jgi:hypothetical protein